MVRQVIFGDYRSLQDLGLVLMDGRRIGYPEVKESYVSLDGSDGVIDYTEYFGQIFYDNRTLELPFAHVVNKIGDLETYYSEVYRKLHGRKMKICFSWDADFYYMGRINVGEWENDGRIAYVTITCNCEPYRYKKDITEISVTVSGTKTITCANLQKRVVPTFEAASEMTITFNGISKTASGTFTIPGVAFVEGDNNLTIEGSGTLKIRYQEKIL